MTGNRRERRTGFGAEAVGRNEAKDTGMVLVLLCLIFGHRHRPGEFLLLPVLLLLLDIVCPAVYLPLARVWFGFSRTLGAVMSRLILTLVFLLLVIPVGFVRRMFGADPMQLKKWKSGSCSVFRAMDRTFRPEDLERPY